MSLTEILGHSYTDAELLKLRRQGKAKRWVVCIFREDKHEHTTKWHPSARAAKAEGMAYVVANNLVIGEYSTWLSNQADYNEEYTSTDRSPKE